MRTIIVTLLAVIVLVSCSSPAAPTTSENTSGKQVSAPGSAYTDVSPVELQTMLANKDFTFVNVHIPFEGDIANTDLSIPYDTIQNELSKLPANKSDKIVLYCRSGRMSSIAAEKLVKLGYTNVYNLAGGMVAWEQAGFPINK